MYGATGGECLLDWPQSVCLFCLSLIGAWSRSVMAGQPDTLSDLTGGGGGLGGRGPPTPTLQAGVSQFTPPRPSLDSDIDISVYLVRMASQ